MRVKAVSSQRNDSFARLSASLFRSIERNDVNPFQCIYSFSHDGKTAYFWPSPEINLTNELAVEVPGLEGEGELKWIDKSTLKAASRVNVKPVTWKDQMLCSDNSDLLASGLILEQIRLVWPGTLIEVHLATGKIALQVMKSEPRSDLPLMLVQDTELEIEQPHTEPRVKAPRPDKPTVFSIVADPHVDHGFTWFSLADLIDRGWKTHFGKVFFKLQPLSKSMKMAEFGLVGRAGPGKRVKPGTMHVHPSVFESGLLNTSYIKLSTVDVSELESLLTVDLKVGIDHGDDSNFMDGFQCESAQFILPSPLKTPNLGIHVPDLFVKIDKSTQLQLDYCLPPVMKICRSKEHPNEAELKRILESMRSGLLLVKGEHGSGKSISAKSLAEQHGCILFDFEPILNNVGQAHLQLEGIFERLNFVPKTTPLIFDSVEWILAPENLESIHEEERWALENLKLVLVDFLEELIGQGRRVVLFVSKTVKEVQRLTVDTLTLSKPSNVESYVRSVKKPQIGWNEFAGNPAAKATLEEAIIWPIKWSSLFKANNFAQFSAVLIYGPTGCGKTALMNSIITALPDVHVVRVRGPELLSKYIGSSEEAVRKVFQEARQHRPSLILLDEIDSLAPRRGHDNTGVTDRVVNQLLTEIDGTGEREGIFIIGSTSRKDLIDPALLRSGRIDIHIPLCLPGFMERKGMIRFLTGNDNVLINELAEKTEGMSPAQLKSLLYDAQLAASDDNKVLELSLANLSINPTQHQLSQELPREFSKLKSTLA